MNQISWAAKYEGKRPILDRDAIGRAVEAYFLVPPGSVRHKLLWG
jgi:hypothetical protein